MEGQSTISNDLKLLYVRKRITDPIWKRWPKRWRDWYRLHHFEGFFRGGIRTIAGVREVSLSKLQRLPPATIRDYDAVIFHFKCNDHPDRPALTTCHEPVSDFRKRVGTVPVILLVTTDHAGRMPGDETLNQVQLVYKREPYRDLGRYDLTNANRDKIHPTVMCSPLVSATLWNRTTIDPSDYGRDTPSEQVDTDVFFLGTSTSEFRIEVVRALRESDLDFEGGLLEKQHPVPDSLQTPRMEQDRFYNQIRSSRINLAVDGWGAFTYRHWELWGLSAFMLSSSTLNDIWIPFDFADGEHYVSFDGTEDLVNTIRTYLDRPEERDRIARNGRTLFEREYDFAKHGRQIESAIETIL